MSMTSPRETLMQAWRMLARDWRGGELQLLVGALAIAVAAVTSVGFFVERLQAGFERDAAQLLGGDLVISADQPMSAAYREQARTRGLRTTESAQFPSMAIAVTEDARWDARHNARSALASQNGWNCVLLAIVVPTSIILSAQYYYEAEQEAAQSAPAAILPNTPSTK
jgi:hypothetical protein